MLTDIYASVTYEPFIRSVVKLNAIMVSVEAPNAIFVSKAEAYPSEATFSCSTLG
jgi:hypothetical protein